MREEMKDGLYIRINPDRNYNDVVWRVVAGIGQYLFLTESTATWSEPLSVEELVDFEIWLVPVPSVANYK